MWIDRPSSRLQLIFGLGTPAPLQVNVVLDPSDKIRNNKKTITKKNSQLFILDLPRIVMCEAELSASMMEGGTVENE